MPALPVPGPREYRHRLRLPPRVRRDIEAFKPNIFHVASPEILGHRAVSLRAAPDLPVVASVHTRFETYPRYYGLAFLEPLVLAPPAPLLPPLRRDLRAVRIDGAAAARPAHELRCRHLVARDRPRNLQSRPARPRLAARAGIADDVLAIGFVGRLVMEKGLDVFSDAIDRLARRRVRHKVLVVGDGPARDWFERRLPDAASPASRRAPTSAARSPRWTCCSTRR